MFRFKDLFLTFPVLGWVNARLSRFLTLGGKLIFVATFFFAAGSSHLDSPVYMLCGASITVLFISYLVTFYFRPDLHLNFNPPPIIAIAKTSLLEIQITNQGSKPVYDLQIFGNSNQTGIQLAAHNEAPILIDTIEPRAKVVSMVPMSGIQRGVFRCCSVNIRSAFPFNLIHTTQSFSGVGQTAVVPNYKPLITSSFITNFQTGISGDHNKSMALAKQEFIGSREYVPGIDTRRWDYAAWARHATPYVCQFDDDGTRSAALLFDNFQATDDNRRFEASLSLLLSITDELHQSGYSIDFFRMGSSGLTLPKNSTARQFRDICLSIADATATKKPNNRLFDNWHGKKDCLVVLVSTGEGHFKSTPETNLDPSIRPNVSCRILVGNESQTHKFSQDWQVVSVEKIEAGEVRL